MDFWTAISDVSAVFTVCGAVWQAGKTLFKKNLHFGVLRQSLSKKIFTLVHSPKVVLKFPDVPLEHYLSGSYARNTQIVLIPGNHDILLAPHHGLQKKLFQYT
jgi:hypothetical protein